MEKMKDLNGNSFVKVERQGISALNSTLGKLSMITECVYMGKHNIGILDTRNMWIYDPVNNKFKRYEKRGSHGGKTLDELFTDEPLLDCDDFSKNTIRHSKTYHIYANESTSISLGTLVAYVKDFVKRDGFVRSDYKELEGNHMDGSGNRLNRYGIETNNTINNMELVTKGDNGAHNEAWARAIKHGFWLKISAEKDKELIEEIRCLPCDTDANYYIFRDGKAYLKPRKAEEVHRIETKCIANIISKYGMRKKVLPKKAFDYYYY